MKSIDKFEINEIEKNRELLEYVYELGCLYCPICDYDEEGWGASGTEVDTSFIRRYNDREINAPFAFEDYINNKDIQDTLNAFKINVEKFWYLLLFAYDFTIGTCKNGRRIKEIPKVDVDKLMQQIKDNIAYADSNYTFINKMKLSLKTDGVSKRITIEDPATLAQMSILYRYASRLYEEGKIEVTNITFEQNSEEEYETILVATFHKLLNDFMFNIYPEISGIKKPEIKAYTTISGSRTLLISRLIYLTTLSDNIKYTGYDDNNKPCPDFLHNQLSSYRKFEISRTNTFYPWMPEFMG